MKKIEIEKLQKSTKIRFCKRCGKNLTLDKFYVKHTKGNENSYRFDSLCKTCNNKSNYKRKDYQRNYNLLRKYKMTKKDYELKSKEQGYRCLICGTLQKDLKKLLSVDHCHKTNKIRGLLCPTCNQGLGLFGDNIELLNNAIKYLEIYKEG